MDKVKIGVIGCGGIANGYHLPALNRIDSVEFGYSCDIIEKRAKKAKEEYGFDKYTLNYKEVLADPEIDAIFIFTKIDMHATIAIDAANAGKDIFMQKPFAYSINEGKEILEAVQKNGVKMTPSFMHRYMDASREASKINQKNEIGNLDHIRIRNACSNPPETAPSYGGCMMDIGVHGIDIIRSITGADIVEVYALKPETKGKQDYGKEVDLTGGEIKAILNYKLSNGISVFHEIFWSQISKTSRFEVEVYGDRGAIYIYNPHRDSNLYLGTGELNNTEWEQVDIKETFFGEIQHRLFIKDIIEGTDKSLTARDGFETLKVIEAARRSMATAEKQKVLEI